jgi:hypothetical protein
VTPFGREIAIQPVADLLPERFFVRGEAQVHTPIMKWIWGPQKRAS